MSERKQISTSKAPGAIGPYSQAVVVGNFLYSSGQIPLDPLTGKIIEGDVRAQTRQVFANLQAVLEAASSDLSRVVKTTVFVTDLGQFAALNETYERCFQEAFDKKAIKNPVFPSRSTVEVKALPKGAQVEIEVLALV